MYQSQIAGLKQDIIKNGGFESCKVLGSFSGIEIKGVRKVPESINQGRHHLFIDLEDYRGLDYWLELNGSKPFYFNKPVNEAACHIDIYGENNTLKIIGKNETVYSQLITGLSSHHTSYGHSSYLVYAVFAKTTDVLIPKSKESLVLISEIEERLNKLKGLLK